MVERGTYFSTGIMLHCEDCYPDVNEEDRATCPLEQFQAKFAVSEQTATDLEKLAKQYGLDSTFYIESNGVPHFICPVKKGSSSGRIAIFSRRR